MREVREVRPRALLCNLFEVKNHPCNMHEAPPAFNDRHFRRLYREAVKQHSPGSRFAHPGETATWTKRNSGSTFAIPSVFTAKRLNNKAQGRASRTLGRLHVIFRKIRMCLETLV